MNKQNKNLQKKIVMHGFLFGTQFGSPGLVAAWILSFCRYTPFLWNYFTDFHIMGGGQLN